jgi:hypothetical protein
LEPDEQLASAITGALQEAAPDALVETTSSLEGAQHLMLGVKPEPFVFDLDATHDLGQDFLYDFRTSRPNAHMSGYSAEIKANPVASPNVLGF